MVLSQRFPGWFEAFGSFRTSEALFFGLRSARKSISAPFRDTTARAHYAGTGLRIRGRMRKIGRAPCRGREWISVVARSLTKQWRGGFRPGRPRDAAPAPPGPIPA